MRLQSGCAAVGVSLNMVQMKVNRVSSTHWGLTDLSRLGMKSEGRGVSVVVRDSLYSTGMS